MPALPGTKKSEEGDMWNRVGVALLAPLWLRALGHAIYDLFAGSILASNDSSTKSINGSLAYPVTMIVVGPLLHRYLTRLGGPRAVAAEYVENFKVP